jgi:chromosome segregation protein
MVYVKRVELSRFKSFGGNNSVPFLPGFTVISGPNGSGKSNILDALLFCLGLASSKGMRADRLPDLINNNQKDNGKALETVVSVTFDLGDLDQLQDESHLTPEEKASLAESGQNNPLSNLSELKITRRLRVAKGGSYSSTFYINDQPATATELHEYLQRLRIYPEGYNVVLQGDVTRIITMNPRERREIIDELAGVAEFDRKIEQTKSTLDDVKEREEKCHIIQQELVENSAKLQEDSEKASKYQVLKAQMQEKKQWQVVINWRYLEQQKEQVNQELIQLANEQNKCHDEQNVIKNNLLVAQEQLDKLNVEIKALGEEEKIAIASKLATDKAKKNQLQKRAEELVNLETEFNRKQQKYQDNIVANQTQIKQLATGINELEKTVIPQLETEYNSAKEEVFKNKQEAQKIASQSQVWLSKQTELNQIITSVQNELNPQVTQQALLTERCEQLQTTIKAENEQLAQLAQEIEEKTGSIEQLTQEVKASESAIQNLAEKLAKVESEVVLNQETINRLQNEQREKHRQLDKLEATKQAQQEAQGTYASKIILNSDLPGVCGLVAQLGEVESRYQKAVEIAAGSRLGYIVVEDDTIASMAIKLLKQQRGGRATFLPLNKIKSPRLDLDINLLTIRGAIDWAINLIEFEPQYQSVFAYVFGNTLVFEDLNSARNLLGKYRMVTIEGELLEPSGAMTGGSVSQRSSLTFGRVSQADAEEFADLRDRIVEIENIIPQLNLKISQKREQIKIWTEELSSERQKRQKTQLMLEQSQNEISRLEREREKIIQANAKHYEQLANDKQELTQLTENIPLLKHELEISQLELKKLEETYDNEEWQNLQKIINEQELILEEKQLNLNDKKEKLQQLNNQNKELINNIKKLAENIDNIIKEINEFQQENLNIEKEIKQINEQIQEAEIIFQELAKKIEVIKNERDQKELEVKRIETDEKKNQWKLEKLILQHQELQVKRQELESKEIKEELPEQIPPIPWLEEEKQLTTEFLLEKLEKVQKEIKKIEKKLEALEPVNMLALEQYEKNQERLQELSDKLNTLAAERTELLLRVENFTTLRFRAFKEAFDAVNENFQNIFATLSDGDGYLKLDDAENPFNGGLTLVAHPKGKAVQRLSSMSGGEKSLTALSFIFALQRYRPSPFYAFDEVDMFLDGANVEKLSKMIQKQAQQAQFIVVSLRRPMIEAAQRTIGVTQAKGAYTQVLGINL